MFHSKYRSLENWNQPDIKTIVEKAFEVKSEINKLTTKNTWLSRATVKTNSRDFEMLSVSDVYKLFCTCIYIFFFFHRIIKNIYRVQILQNNETSSTSEICDICQVSSVTLLKDDTCDSIKVSLENIEQELCKRCRRNPEPEPSEICDRCAEILNSA